MVCSCHPASRAKAEMPANFSLQAAWTPVRKTRMVCMRRVYHISSVNGFRWFVHDEVHAVTKMDDTPLW